MPRLQVAESAILARMEESRRLRSALIGYAAMVILALAIIAGLFALTLTFLGVPIPWSH